MEAGREHPRPRQYFCRHYSGARMVSMYVRSAHTRLCAALALGVLAVCSGFAATSERPKAGKVEIFKLSEVKPGMQATAWTVFSGFDVEAVPVEIIGISRNGNGPKQDIIIGKMGGKAQDECRGRHERQPSLHRWKTGGR